MSSASGTRLLDVLASIGGEEAVCEPRSAELTDASEASGLRLRADAPVEPADAEGVAALVARCYEHDIPVTLWGAGTG